MKSIYALILSSLVIFSTSSFGSGIGMVLRAELIIKRCTDLGCHYYVLINPEQLEKAREFANRSGESKGENKFIRIFGTQLTFRIVKTDGHSLRDTKLNGKNKNDSFVLISREYNKGLAD